MMLSSQKDFACERFSFKSPFFKAFHS